MNGGDLPSDLIIDILSRLSVKSLTRLKCVCRSWRSLFEKPTFITQHLNNNNKRDDSILLRYCTHDPLRYFYAFLSYETLAMVEKVNLRDHIEFSRGIPYLDIVACCNGIVCVELLDNIRCYICLWNPATRQFRKLMHDPRRNRHYGSRRSSGFGYDAKGNDYKVIQLPCYDSSSAYHPHIYDLSSNSWRTCDTTAPVASYGLGDGVRVYTNGIFSWLVSDGYPNNRLIVSFDMSKEVFITTELPDKINEGTSSQSLGALNKCLVLLRLTTNYWSPNDDDFEGEILVLNNYGVKESWTKLYKMRPGVCGFYLLPMSFWKNGDILATNMCKGKLFVLNPKKQEITNVPHLDSILISALPWIWVYKESLVPII